MLLVFHGSIMSVFPLFKRVVGLEFIMHNLSENAFFSDLLKISCHESFLKGWIAQLLVFLTCFLVVDSSILCGKLSFQ